ncbi:MAG TPA: hypothetical protein VN843_03800 [Anaerolineales bacterium]|nr:hypothetical protein [Anaerolineales bacterium]
MLISNSQTRVQAADSGLTRHLGTASAILRVYREELIELLNAGVLINRLWMLALQMTNC